MTEYEKVRRQIEEMERFVVNTTIEESIRTKITNENLNLSLKERRYILMKYLNGNRATGDSLKVLLFFIFYLLVDLLIERYGEDEILPVFFDETTPIELVWNERLLEYWTPIDREWERSNLPIILMWVVSQYQTIQDNSDDIILEEHAFFEIHNRSKMNKFGLLIKEFWKKMVICNQLVLPANLKSQSVEYGLNSKLIDWGDVILARINFSRLF